MNYRPASGVGASMDAPETIAIRRLARLLPSIALMVVCHFAFTLSTNAEELTSGTGSRQAKQQALQAIPFQQLTPQAQAKIGDTLKSPSIYRRLPVTAIDIDPDYFVFLARHPEVVVNIWKIMGVTKMTTTRTGPFTLRTDDGVGTVSDIELIYGTENLHIFYGVGTYEGPVLKRKLRGDCVMVMRTEYSQDRNGTKVATNQLDVFLKIENATAGLIAKTLKPIVGSTADHNFVESLNFLQRLNDTTQKNGPGVQHMANRLSDINQETRSKFIQVAGLVAERNGGTKATVEPAGGFDVPTYSTSGYGARQSLPTRPASFHSPVQQMQRTQQPTRHYGSPRTSQVPYQAPTYEDESYYHRR